MLEQIALGGTMIALPIYLQMVLEYNAMEAGLSLAPLSLTMFATAILAGKKAGDRRPSGIIRVGFALLTVGLVLLLPIVPRADSGWALLVPLVIAGLGMGLLVSQLNNYTLAPIMAESSTVLRPAEQERVAQALEDDAEVMRNSALEELLASQPAETRAEIIRLNTDARPRALQVALLIPMLASLLGFVNSFRMARLPDPAPSSAADGMVMA
jgi:hypothetical protein